MGHSPELIESAGFAGLEKLAYFSAAIAGSSRTYALKTVENSLAIIQPLQEMGGIPLIRSVFNLGIKMAADDWNYALEFFEKSPAIVSKLQGQGAGFDLLDQALRAVPFSAQLTLTFLDAAPYLIDRLGPTGLDSIWQCALDMAADHTEKAVILLRESLGIVDRLLAFVTPGQVVKIFELGRDLAGLGSEPTLEFILGSIELARQFDFSTLKVVSDTAKEIAATSRNTAAAFLKAAPSLLSRVDQQGLRKIVDRVVPIARDNWETASRILLKAPDVIDRLGPEGSGEDHGFFRFSGPGELVDRSSIPRKMSSSY